MPLMRSGREAVKGVAPICNGLERVTTTCRRGVSTSMKGSAALRENLHPTIQSEATLRRRHSRRMVEKFLGAPFY